MKPTIVHKTAENRFFHEMQIRKTLLYSISRRSKYASHLYSLPVENLTDFGVDVRYAFFELLQLNLAKLFVNSKMQKYNVHRLLDQFQFEPFLEGRLPKEQLQSFRERLVSFDQTILGIRGVRDELIAHTDFLGGVAPLSSFFPTIEKLIDFGFGLLDVCSRAVDLTPVHNVLHQPLSTELELFKKEADSLAP